MNDDDCYNVTDPDEEKQFTRAVEGDNPIKSDEEVNKILGH